MIELNEIALVMVGSLTTFLGAYFLWRFQYKREQSRLLLDRLETLLNVSERYITSLEVNFLNRHAVMMHQLTVDQMHGLESAEKPDLYSIAPYTQLHTLVSLYFPNLQKALGELHRSRGKCYAVFDQYLKVYRQYGHHDQVDVRVFAAALNEFGRSADAFRGEIVAEANKLTNAGSSYKSIDDLSDEGS